MINKSVIRGIYLSLIIWVLAVLVYSILEIYVINSYRYTDGIGFGNLVTSGFHLLLVSIIFGGYLGYIFSQEKHPVLKKIIGFTIIPILILVFMYQPLTSGDPFPDSYYLLLNPLINLVAVLIGFISYISLILFFMKDSIDSKIEHRNYYIQYSSSIIMPWVILVILSAGGFSFAYSYYDALFYVVPLLLVQGILIFIYSKKLNEIKKSKS